MGGFFNNQPNFTPVNPIGSTAGVSGPQLSAALAGNPLLKGISPSQVAGIGPAQSGGFLSSLSSPTGGGAGNNTAETGTNTALSLGSMIPGPQQPFVAGAAALAPTVEGMFGGKSGGQPMQLPAPSQWQPNRTQISPVNMAPQDASFSDLLKLITQMRG